MAKEQEDDALVEKQIEACMSTTKDEITNHSCHLVSDVLGF